MNESLGQKVDRQLLADLQFYKLSQPGKFIDWTRGCPEGREVEHLGDTFESNSEVYVLNESGETIAGGWVDCFYNEDDDYFIAYWDGLSVYASNISPRAVVRSFEQRGVGIPKHVWEAIPQKYQKDTPFSETIEYEHKS